MQFEDFHQGQFIELGPVTVSEAEVVDFASKYDPQPFHTDKAFAAASRWGGLIASGWHTAALAMRMMVDGVLAGSTSVGSPGIDKLRWMQPVRPGDTLRLRVEVLEVRRSQSRPNLGIVTSRWRVFNQHAQEVASLEGTSLFEVKPEVQSGVKA